jgi:uncharacterized protein (TIGR02147 family)
MDNVTQPIQKILREKLTERQLKNPSYSLRALARFLGFNPAILSMILNGKRQASAKVALQIADGLCLSPEERLELFQSYAPSQNAEKKSSAEIRQSVELQADTFRLISDWYHFAILSLAETQDFQSDATFVANRLGISKKLAEGALDRLLRLGLLEESEDGRLQVTGQNYTTSSDIKSLSLRKSHFKNLELAQRSLETDALEERDFSAVTMAIDPTLLPQAKARIRKFREELAAFLSSGSKNEVYKMCVQLFPLTKKGENS